MKNLTDNVNQLSPTSFKLIINSQDYSNTEYFVVSATLPGLTIAASSTHFRNQRGWVPGDTVEYEQLSMRIAMDENMTVYKEIHNWMTGFTNATDLPRHDITLLVLTSHNNPNQGFRFANAFPVSLGSIEFSSQQSDAEYAYIDVTFQYDYFKIEDKNVC